ncbi:MAG: threonine dehydratase [Alphaproteobacteria bacterium]
MTRARLDAIRSATELVYRHMPATPQHCWPLLSARCGAQVWVKHENHTPIGAFKLRGGLVYMDDVSRYSGAPAGVITATRGNHGQSVALAASRAGMRAVIVVPEGNSTEKNAAMRAFGADLVVHGHDFQAAAEYAAARAEAEGLHMLPAFDERLVRGVGTYALEFLTAVPDLDTVYVPIGMGSGICGTISVRDGLGLRTEIVGVVAAGAPSYALSVAAGRPVPTERADTMADGLACRTPHPDALATIMAGAARIVTVDDAAIRAAMRAYYTDTHNLAEGAGAAALAALLAEGETMRGRRVGLVLSGGNVDMDVYRAVLSDG